MTSLFSAELGQGTHALTTSTKVRDRGTGPVAAWLRTALSRFQPDQPAALARRDMVAATRVRHIDSAPRCRMCATRGTRRVCATCATAGFIELHCGCVQRPDGSRYACDAGVERWLETLLPGDVGFDPTAASAFKAWADAASASGDCSVTSFRDANWERLWSQR